MKGIIIFATVLTAFVITADAQCNGAYTSERNKDSTFSGRWNRGCFLGNKDVEINADGSSNDLEVFDSKNMRASVIDSIVKLYAQHNTDVTARTSSIYMESDKNTYIKGDNVWVMFKNNKNINYNGRGGNDFLTKFMDNKNVDVQGNNNNIIASDNKNLRIGGDNNRLEVSHTLNHDILPATSNTFTVTSGGLQSFNYGVQYVGEAKISGELYELGAFQFVIARDFYVGAINVNIQSPFSSVQKSYSQIVLQAQKNGYVQELKISGDRVEEVRPNSFNVYINNWSRHN